MTRTARTRRYGVKIREFDPALAAGIHFYATIWRYDPAQESYADRIEEHRCTRPLTAHQAARINHKDSHSWLGNLGGGYQAGDPSYRFETKDDALSAAIEDLRATYGDSFAIELGDHIALDNPVVVDAHSSEIRPEALEDGARNET